MAKKQPFEIISEYLERVERVRKDSKGKFDSMSEKKQQDLLDLDYLASILASLYFDELVDQKKNLSQEEVS